MSVPPLLPTVSRPLPTASSHLPNANSRVDVSDLSVRIYTPESALKHPKVMLRELRADLNAGRELAWRLFVLDVKSQYRQTYLGYLWAFLPPLFAALTFIFLQSQGITNIEGNVVPYPAFVIMGTLLWQTFVDAVQSPLTSVNGARSMLAKINFPREAILMAGLYGVAFNFLIRMSLLFVVMVAWRVSPGLSLIYFPFAMLGVVLLGFAIGMTLVPIGSLYGDISRALPFVTQFWMLLTPVVYPARAEGLAGWLTLWNPVSPLVITARESLTNQPLTSIPASVGVIAISTLVALCGLLAYRLVMPRLIERMGG